MTSVRELVRRLVPVTMRLQLSLRGLPTTPPAGHVRFGDLRRTTPIADDFGYGRGGPVDRYYIEAFLHEHRDDVRGRVLEIGDSTYTRRFGGTRVAQADVLHVDAGHPGATFSGDLADGSFLPAAAFDCVILTQTLQFIYDFAGALRTVARVLAPDGVLLMTVPGISSLDSAATGWGATWHYTFTGPSLRRMCADAFDGFATELSTYGNVLAAVALLHGLGRDDVTTAELDVHQLEYTLIHAVRVVKPAGG